MDLANKISQTWERLTGTNEGIVALIVSVLVFTVLYYYMMKFLADNNSSALVMLFVFVMLVGAAILTFINVNHLHILSCIK